VAPKLRIPENTLDVLPQSEVLNAWVFGEFLASFTEPVKELKKNSECIQTSNLGVRTSVSSGDTICASK